MAIDPSSWPGASKRGKQLRRWAFKSLSRAGLRNSTFKGDLAKKFIDLDIAFLAAFWRHSGLWQELAGQVAAAEETASASGETAPALDKVLPSPEEGGPLCAAMLILSRIRGRVHSAHEAYRRSGESSAELDRGVAESGGAGPAAGSALPSSGAGGGSEKAASDGHDGSAGATTGLDTSTIGVGDGSERRHRPRLQMEIHHPTSGKGFETHATGALMLWAYCGAGAGPLRHEGLARASRASAASHAHNPPT